MDQILREKLEAALTTEISKALESNSISENEADDSSVDFLDMVQEYQDEQQFIEDFAIFIGKYPFATSVGDYYMAHIQNNNTEQHIDEIRKQLHSYIQE